MTIYFNKIPENCNRYGENRPNFIENKVQKQKTVLRYINPKRHLKSHCNIEQSVCKQKIQNLLNIKNGSNFVEKKKRNPRRELPLVTEGQCMPICVFFVCFRKNCSINKQTGELFKNGPCLCLPNNNDSQIKTNDTSTPRKELLYLYYEYGSRSDLRSSPKEPQETKIPHGDILLSMPSQNS